MAGSRKLIIHSLILCILIEICYCLQCLSKNGSPVDWFAVYKLPELRHGKTPVLHEGRGFYYMDQNNPSLVLSDKGMDDTGHAVYNTLQQIYDNKTTIAYIMYNDQAPKKSPSLNHGHSKGTVAFDKTGGFWLVHSTPEFPPMKSDGYSWPKSACTFGQTFLCISMNYNMMDRMGSVFMYTYPKIYDTSLPSVFSADNPVLSNMILGPKQHHVMDPPWYNVTQIISKGNNKFMSYEKFRDFHKDLYDGLLSTALQEDLLVETWREHGYSHNDLPSNCSIQYKVYNIETMIFPDEGIAFKTSKDHSKWAVSKNGGDWLCIGDINRQMTQFKRAGTQVCFQNHQAWTSFRNLVNQTEPCQ
ncbi:plancitoxin-1-like [Mytilus californianus]|uniref:plancitoxin-1-like n=1 Tax=Mytilus californianus TaxID=6549 RepID=UPI002245DCAF|nr:plancitoxin-1-like [Mytilus californianus]